MTSKGTQNRNNFGDFRCANAGAKALRHQNGQFYARAD